ncbi:MAG: TldD/PmbA family protein [Methanomassiliicoccales archaeon]|nr:TldD/PmbA family protein [Methanomassiliicoccales archaeon]
MKAEDICDFVLKICKSEGASDVAVTVTEVEETMIRFSNNEITVSNALKEASSFIFVADREKKAGVGVADLSKKTLLSSAKRVVSSARRSPPGDVYAPLPKGPFRYDEAALDQPRLEMRPEDLVGLVQAAVEAGLKEGAERMAGSLIARNGRVILRTTGDVITSARSSGIEMSIRAFLSSLASGHSTAIASSEKDFAPEEVGAEAGRLAKAAANPSEGEPGECQAILGPLVFADIVCQVGRSASAFNVDAGLSFFGGKIGQNVASEKLNVADDATLRGSYGAFPFDAEGLPTRRTEIIESGVLKSYLHNSSTAKKFGTQSTANAGLIAPRPFNLVVGEGNKTLEDLIRSVDNGIYVTNDWYLRYQNYATGDFSTIPRDAMFLIRNGQIEKPIRELRISDNMIRILQSVSSLTRNRTWVKWWEVEVPTLSPAALVDKVNFTKSSM